MRYMGREQERKEKYEIIIPEKTFIVNNFEEVRKIYEQYRGRGITIRRIENERT